MPMVLGAVAGIGLLLGSVYLYRKRAKPRADGERALKEGARTAGGGDDAPLTVDDILKAGTSAASKAATSPRPQLAPIPLSDASQKAKGRRRSCMAHIEGESAVSRDKPEPLRRTSSQAKLPTDTASLPALPPPKLVSSNWRPPPKRKNLEAMGFFGETQHLEAAPPRDEKMRHNSCNLRKQPNDPRKRSCMMVSRPDLHHRL